MTKKLDLRASTDEVIEELILIVKGMAPKRATENDDTVLVRI